VGTDLAPPLWSLVGRRPSDVALADDRDTRTWQELESRTNAVGHGAEALGLVPGDHLALVAGNRAAFVEVVLGVQRAGMVVSPLKRTWTAEEIAPVLADAGTRLVVTDTDAGRRAAADAGVAVLDLDDGYDGWLERQDDAPHARDRGGWRMSYTSGTTGRPKGVVRPDRGTPWCEAFAAGAAMGELMYLPGDGPHLVVSPLFHGGPLTFSLYALAAGAPMRILPRWSPEAALDALVDGVVSTSMVPTMFRQLLALPEPRRTGFHAPALRTVLHGGEPCPPDVKRRMIEWWGPVLVEYFGFSEGGMSVATTEDWLARPGTVGRPMPYQQVRILGSDGRRLSPGEEGQVYFAPLAGGRTFSYLNDDDKTEAAYRDDAFTAGDLGWVDDDGYLYISGRVADVIVSAGVNVYPAEIEAVLGAVPGVVDIAVVGAPDPERGETVAAFIVADDDAVLTAVQAAADAHLAGYKRPRQLHRRDALPRDPTGKLLRTALRAELWSEHALQAHFGSTPQNRP